jgi:hypothetical protein
MFSTIIFVIKLSRIVNVYYDSLWEQTKQDSQCFVL